MGFLDGFTEITLALFVDYRRLPRFDGTAMRKYFQVGYTTIKTLDEWDSLYLQLKIMESSAETIDDLLDYLKNKYPHLLEDLDFLRLVKSRFDTTSNGNTLQKEDGSPDWNPVESGGGQSFPATPIFIGVTSGTYFNGGSRTPTVPAGAVAGDTLIVFASYRGGEPSFTSENQSIMEGGTQTWNGIHQPSTTQYVMHTVYNDNPSLGTLPDPGWSNILNWVVLAFRGVSSVGVLHHGVRGFNANLTIPDGSVTVVNQTFFDTAGSFAPPAGWNQNSQSGYAGQFVAWRPYTQGSTENLTLTALTSNPNGYDHITILSLLGALVPFAPVDVEVLKKAVEVPLTSGTLANGATVNLDLETIGRKATLWAVTAHNATGLWWVRAYSTASRRTDDAGRSYTVDPANVDACLFEILLNATVTVPYVLDARVSNRDVPTTPKIYLAITNLSGASATLSLTLEAMIEEA